MASGLSTDWAARRERGFSLPHPPVSLTIFLTLESAIVQAWRILHTKPPFDPKTAKETDIAQNFRAEGCFGNPGNSFFCLSRIGCINTR